MSENPYEAPQRVLTKQSRRHRFFAFGVTITVISFAGLLALQYLRYEGLLSADSPVTVRYAAFAVFLVFYLSFFGSLLALFVGVVGLVVAWVWKRWREAAATR